MRPAGDVRKALVDAVQPAPGRTLQELADRACVGMDAARRTMDNLRRAGVVQRGPDKVVGYRNRPVATYLPAGYAAAAANDASINHLCAVLRAWGRW